MREVLDRLVPNVTVNNRTAISEDAPLETAGRFFVFRGFTLDAMQPCGYRLAHDKTEADN
jgi:hypothetical protein